MASPDTEPRDLQPHTGVGDQNPAHELQPPGRWEREAEAMNEAGPEDSVTKSSRVYFFIILAIIAAAIAVFLILHPQTSD